MSDTQAKDKNSTSSETSKDKTPESPEAVVRISGLNNSKDSKSPSAFRTISEVAEEINVAQHVLRFWETKFNQIKPLKRGGGRRYYRPEDVALLKHIHYLLYSAGYTIKGVQKLFKGQSKHQIIGNLIEKGSLKTQPSPYSDGKAAQAAGLSGDRTSLSGKQRSILEAMLGDLKQMRDIIKG